MRLFVLLAFLMYMGCAQRISNETYQDNPIGLLSERLIREFVLNALEEPNDPFVTGLWDEARGQVFFWTNGPFFSPLLYKMNYRDLLTAGNTSAFFVSNFTGGAAEISVDTGAYATAEDILVLAGGRTLFQFTTASQDLDAGRSASFVFPELVLPFTSYNTGGTMWLPQFRGNSGNQPQLIGVDWNKYTQGPTGARTFDVVDEQITKAFYHNNSGLAFLGSRTGVVQIRDGNANDQMIISRFVVEDARITGFAYDPDHSRIFICLDIGNGVRLLKLSTAQGLDYWNGKTINTTVVADPVYSAVVNLLTSGSCEDILIDTPTGTGFVSMADSTGIGFLAKVNLRTLEAVITYIPIQRENSRLVSLHLEEIGGKKYLFGLSTYSIAVWSFTTACSLDCNADGGRGQCVDGFCECTNEWWGLSCISPSCDPPCGDYEDPFRGECINGQCICQPRWTGEACLEQRCPNDCQGNGNCNLDANYTCECDEVRDGDDCSGLKFERCEQLNNMTFERTSRQDACLSLNPYLGCGYCGGEYDLCFDGNRAGPVGDDVGGLIDACMWWFYDGSWNPAFLVFIIVMMASWGIMFLLNAYSMLVEDLKFAKLRTENSNPHYYGTKGYQKKLWWRDERSHKSWKMYDQMQFLSAYGVINALFTTKLYNFLTFWNWSLFIIPFGGVFEYEGHSPMRSFNWTPIHFPFPPIPPGAWTGDEVNRTKREIYIERLDYTATESSVKRDYEQFINSAETKGDLIFPTAVIWFLIVFFGFLILYLVYYLIMVYIVYKGKDVYKTILGYRFKHIIARTLNAFYFPAVFLSVFAIQVDQKPVIALAIGFGLIIIGCGLPGFFVLLTQQPLLTEWFDPALRIPFGSFYAPFQKKRIKFQLAYYFRKFAAGCALAAMARGFNPDDEALFWAQMIVSLAVFVIYLVLLLWKRPYIDMIHLIIDAALTLLNGVTILLSLLAIQADTGTQDAIQWIVLVVQIPCMFLVIVGYCWSTMFYAGYTSPKQFFCCEGKPKNEDDDALIQAGGEGGVASGPGGNAPEDKGPEDFSADDALAELNLPSSGEDVR